jgi:release factor glutamine methyltransferase
MRTVLEIIKMSTDFLEGKGVEQARLQAELLVGHALGLKRMQLYLQFERPLLEPELETIRGLLRRRGQREPLQYIVGTTEFFGLTLKVDRRALIPRPETEYLVSLLTERVNPPARLLDLGTGTGAIALALAAHWPNCSVLALDVSPEAVALAEENARATGLADRVTVRPSDWFAAL